MFPLFAPFLGVFIMDKKVVDKDKMFSFIASADKVIKRSNGVVDVLTYAIRGLVNCLLGGVLIEK